MVQDRFSSRDRWCRGARVLLGTACGRYGRLRAQVVWGSERLPTGAVGIARRAPPANFVPSGTESIGTMFTDSR
jgi:hypothetical protein